MNGERDTHVKQILQAIESGRLPPSETERRLRELVETEATRMDRWPNEEFISVCTALWTELHGATDEDYEARAARLRMRIQQTLRDRKTQRARRQLMFKVAAALLILVVAVSGPLRLVWFDHWSTPDEQQHVIMGHEITAEMVAAAIADNDLSDTGTMAVDDLSGLDDILGFDLNVPSVLAENWTADRCFINYAPGYIKVSVIYANNEEPSQQVTSVINLYTDVEFAYFSFEQSRVGERVQINGYDIYVSDNEERSSACWYNNVMYVIVTGDVNADNIDKIMLSLIGGEYE